MKKLTSISGINIFTSNPKIPLLDLFFKWNVLVVKDIFSNIELSCSNVQIGMTKWADPACPEWAALLCIWSSSGFLK